MASTAFHNDTVPEHEKPDCSTNTLLGSLQRLSTGNRK